MLVLAVKILSNTKVRKLDKKIDVWGKKNRTPSIKLLANNSLSHKKWW